jgi:hypothetical protein
MERIIMDVSKGELDYIREALEAKHKSLISYLERCEDEAKKPIDSSLWNDFFKQNVTQPEKTTAPAPVEKKPHWTQTAKGRKIMASRRTRGSK